MVDNRGAAGSGRNLMRIAVVSDIHGNRTALDAVLADLRETSPDLILHGGDLADNGSSPAGIVDRVRDFGSSQPRRGPVRRTGARCARCEARQKIPMKAQQTGRDSVQFPQHDSFSSACSGLAAARKISRCRRLQ